MYVTVCVFTHAILQKRVNKIKGHAKTASLCMYAKDFQRNFVSVHWFLRACACLHEWCMCAKGERDDRGPGGTETYVADSTPFSFYYQIIHDKQLWRLAKVRQAGKKKKRSGDKSRGGHLDAANIASVMQHVCVTSNVTFTWCSHPCVILRYGGVTVMVLISYRLSPSQHKRLAMEKCYHLSDYKKKMSGDNTINRACKIWINGSL